MGDGLKNEGGEAPVKGLPLECLACNAARCAALFQGLSLLHRPAATQSRERSFEEVFNGGFAFV